MTGPQPLIGFGAVHHRRLRPARNQFARPGYFLLLPMRSLAGRNAPAAGASRRDSPLAINQSGCISFHDADHGDGRGPELGGALAWLDEQLAQAGIHKAVGEVWLQCYPRVLGFAFKPVSFWYCYGAAEGELAAVVVEVNNTFGQRHAYVLDQPQWGQTHLADKAFHVSPFCKIEGHYRFKFLNSGMAEAGEVAVRIDHYVDQHLILATSQFGSLKNLTRHTLRRAFWSYPAFTWGVVLHIHWQALRLWLKKVPWHPHPT